MNNLLVIVVGILAYFWFKSKSLVFSSDSNTDQSEETELKKETVKEITKVPTRNNLGMKSPDLSYLGDSIEKFRTNKPFDVKSIFTSIQDKKPEVVKQTFSRTVSNSLLTADRKEVQEIYSRTLSSPDVGRLPIAPKSFITSYTPQNWGFNSIQW